MGGFVQGRGRLGLLAAVAGLALAAAAPASARDLVIHAGRLIDGVSKTPRTQVSILVHDDRITSVEPGFVTPAGAEVVDLSNATVLPGLIDCHVHITGEFDGGNPVAEAVTTTGYDSAYVSVGAAKRTLQAGFTSVRDVGADPMVVIAMKRAIAKGEIEGPRMFVAGPPLGPTGGHGDPSNGLDPELSHPHWTDALVDSPEQARRAVRSCTPWART
jgi:imidazolonepropionase-like amidohydrolase